MRIFGDLRTFFPTKSSLALVTTQQLTVSGSEMWFLSKLGSSKNIWRELTGKCCGKTTKGMAEFWKPGPKIESLPIFPISRRLSQAIGDVYDFLVFISRKNLWRSGKSEVPGRVGFYRHTRKRPCTDADSFQSLSITPSVSTMPIDCLS